MKLLNTLLIVFVMGLTVGCGSESGNKKASQKVYAGESQVEQGEIAAATDGSIPGQDVHSQTKLGAEPYPQDFGSKYPNGYENNPNQQGCDPRYDSNCQNQIIYKQGCGQNINNCGNCNCSCSNCRVGCRVKKTPCQRKIERQARADARKAKLQARRAVRQDERDARRQNRSRNCNSQRTYNKGNDYYSPIDKGQNTPQQNCYR